MPAKKVQLTKSPKAKKTAVSVVDEKPKPLDAGWLSIEELSVEEREAESAKFTKGKEAPGGEHNPHALGDYEFNRVGDVIWKRLRPEFLKGEKKSKKPYMPSKKINLSQITDEVANRAANRYAEALKRGVESIASSVSPNIQNIQLDLIDFSPLNPRKHFSQAKHEELTESMREHGFTISVVTVRPKGPGALAEPMQPDHEEGRWVLVHPETRTWFLMNLTKEEAQTLAATTYQTRYELVCGECRLRAAHSASLEHAPAFVRELTDAQVLEIMMIENIQRSDLTRIEEGEGFAAMLALRDESGQKVYTIVELARKLGKTLDAVRDGIQLCRLEGEAREWVANNQLHVRVGLILARIPDATMRAQAAQEVLHPKFKKEPLNREEAETLISEKYCRSLRGVRWEVGDFALVNPILDEEGNRVGGGACEDCPMNSVNREGAEANAKKGAMCLNVACWQAKDKASYALWSAKKEKAGLVPVSLDDPDIYLKWDKSDVGYGFINLSKKPEAHEVTNETEIDETWGQIVEKMDVPKQVMILPNGEEVIFAKRELVKTAAVMARPELFEKDHDEMTPEERAAQRSAETRERELENYQKRSMRDALLEEMLERQGVPPPELWLALLSNQEINLPEIDEETRRGYGLTVNEGDDETDAVEAWARTATPAQAMAAFVDYITFETYGVDESEVLTAFGLQSAVIEENAKGEFAAAELVARKMAELEAEKANK